MHPEYVVAFVGVGEGDGAHAYFHIQYRKPGASVTHEQVWLYQDQGGKEWVCIHRSPERVFTPYK